jgi:tRNA(Ile)-lysidine synthase
MVRKILDIIKEYNLIEKGDTILVGLSGGPDSVCLLHILYRLKEELGIFLFAAHVNHMLRGEDADKDQEYVDLLCKKFNIGLFIKKCNIRELASQRGITIEEAGREVRYDFFEECSKKIAASKIAVAHNKNDQAETVLMNILRGTGTDGLRGMEHNRAKIIRPLLDISREEIETYCKDNNLNPRIDISNNESVYTRNKVRLELIPFIDNSFNTKVVDSIYKMSLIVRDDYDFIDGYAEDRYKKSIVKIEENSISLSTDEVINNHPAIIKRIIRKAIASVRGHINGIHNRHIQDVFTLCLEGRTGAEIHLPGGLKALKSYNIIRFFYPDNKDTVTFFEAPVEVPGITQVKHNNKSIFLKANIIDVSSEYLLDKKTRRSVEKYRNLSCSFASSIEIPSICAPATVKCPPPPSFSIIT